MNSRNSDFIMRYNQRSLYPLVDDKLQTKKLAVDAGMAVPELYGVISSPHDIRRLPAILKGRTRFVIKPANGSSGDGIIVVKGVQNGRYQKFSGQLLDQEEIDYHMSSTLNGLYSLGGQLDRVIIEYCVRPDPLFRAVSYQGVPDIRIIVFLGHPVMAMARLPTRASSGKANLHQGAIGVAIDLATGTTLGGVWKNGTIKEHPDSGKPVSGITIPYWDEILLLAARCYELSRLGYVGVDVVIDRNLGPLILELNARPGLNIQIANQRGLVHRLRLVEQTGDPKASVDHRVLFSRKHFKVSDAPLPVPELAESLG
ncbi:MAG: alpha-L-glutamate ligase-like protein [Gammaproteobacteria bacterium]